MGRTGPRWRCNALILRAFWRSSTASAAASKIPMMLQAGLALTPAPSAAFPKRIMAAASQYSAPRVLSLGAFRPDGPARVSVASKCSQSPNHSETVLYGRDTRYLPQKLGEHGIGPATWAQAWG